MDQSNCILTFYLFGKKMEATGSYQSIQTMLLSHANCQYFEVAVKFFYEGHSAEYVQNDDIHTIPQNKLNIAAPQPKNIVSLKPVLDDLEEKSAGFLLLKQSFIDKIMWAIYISELSNLRFKASKD